MTITLDRRREYDQRYREEHPARWRLDVQLRNARYRHRRKPTDKLAATIARLEAEIERLREDA